jgi:hypothetical protein
MGKKSIAQKCLQLSGLFEAELLVELMLRYWEHPLAQDKDFRNNLLERTVEALRASIDGQVLIEGVPPAKMNLISAIWYAEWSDLSQVDEDPAGKRKDWLEKLRRAIPSCFCDPGNL